MLSPHKGEDSPGQASSVSGPQGIGDRWLRRPVDQSVAQTRAQCAEPPHGCIRSSDGVTSGVDLGSRVSRESSDPSKALACFTRGALHRPDASADRSVDGRPPRRELSVIPVKALTDLAAGDQSSPRRRTFGTSSPSPESSWPLGGVDTESLVMVGSHRASPREWGRDRSCSPGRGTCGRRLRPPGGRGRATHPMYGVGHPEEALPRTVSQGASGPGVPSRIHRGLCP